MAVNIYDLMLFRNRFSFMRLSSFFFLSFYLFLAFFSGALFIAFWIRDERTHIVGVLLFCDKFWKNLRNFFELVESLILIDDK